MKVILRYLKPFGGVVVLCLLLLFGQAACDLSLPNKMSDMVNVGIQQGGIEAGAPDALRAEGLSLLEAFLSPEDSAQLEASYNRIEPGSSEAQRLSQEIPLLREQAVAVLREDVTQEDRPALDQIYSRAGYSMLLYLQGENTQAELAQAAQSLAQAQGIPGIDGTSQEAGALYETEQPAFGQGQDLSSLDFSQGLEDVDMETLYQLTPLLSLVPQESLEAARESAAASDSMLGEQVGVTLTRLFYQELGWDMEAIQSQYIVNRGLQMLGIALLGAIATSSEPQ